MASREHNKSLSRKENLTKQKLLIYVKYEDHVLFKDCDSSSLKPSVRKAVGWLTFENSQFMQICSDMPEELQPNEKTVESGLLILKCTILSACEVGFGKIFKQDRTGYCGQENSPINGEKEKCKR